MEQYRDKKIILPISGMRCASCALTIEAAVEAFGDVINVSVKSVSKKAHIESMIRGQLLL